MILCASWTWVTVYFLRLGTFSATQLNSDQSLSCVNSLGPRGLQNTRLPSPSPTPGAYSNSCPLSWWCHTTISSSVIPFSAHPQSFPASGSSQLSQLFASGGQSIEVSASASVLPMNIQDWFPLGWPGWIFLQPKGLSRVFPNTIVQKHHFNVWQNSLQKKKKASMLQCSTFFIAQLLHAYMTTGKTIALTRRTLLAK